jgi:hypothetical protein
MEHRVGHRYSPLDPPQKFTQGLENTSNCILLRTCHPAHLVGSIIVTRERLIAGGLSKFERFYSILLLMVRRGCPVAPGGVFRYRPGQKSGGGGGAWFERLEQTAVLYQCAPTIGDLPHME